MRYLSEAKDLSALESRNFSWSQSPFSIQLECGSGRPSNERIDKIRDELETHIAPPPGRLWHAAGIDDVLNMIEVWDSEEAGQDFSDEQLSEAKRELDMFAERQTLPIIDPWQGATHNVRARVRGGTHARGVAIEAR